MAEVANTCPFEPTDKTTIDATTTMRSRTRNRKKTKKLLSKFYTYEV